MLRPSRALAHTTPLYWFQYFNGSVVDPFARAVNNKQVMYDTENVFVVFLVDCR